MLQDDSVMDRGPLLPTPADPRRAAEAEERGRRALRERSESWDKEHGERAEKLAAELLSDTPNPGADEVLLLRLAASEAALAERLGYLQVQLAERAILLVDQASLVLQVTKALKDAVAVSGALGRRVESLLGTASVLRAQRELASAGTTGRSHLRAA